MYLHTYNKPLLIMKIYFFTKWINSFYNSHGGMGERELSGQMHAIYPLMINYGFLITSAEIIEIGSTGTFWYGPTFSVLTLDILSTTSMPFTTLPKTA